MLQHQKQNLHWIDSFQKIFWREKQEKSWTEEKHWGLGCSTSFCSKERILWGNTESHRGERQALLCGQQTDSSGLMCLQRSECKTIWRSEEDYTHFSDGHSFEAGSKRTDWNAVLWKSPEALLSWFCFQAARLSSNLLKLSAAVVCQDLQPENQPLFHFSLYVWVCLKGRSFYFIFSVVQTPLTGNLFFWMSLFKVRHFYRILRKIWSSDVWWQQRDKAETKK